VIKKHHQNLSSKKQNITHRSMLGNRATNETLGQTTNFNAVTDRFLITY